MTNFIKVRKRSRKGELPSRGEVLMPLLTVLSDGKERDYSEINKQLAKFFGLTPEQVEERIATGKESIFSTRTRNARLVLIKEGFVQRNEERGTYVITEKGKELLASNLDESEIEDRIDVDSGDPVAVIEDKFQEVRKQLAQELINRVKSNKDTFLETLVNDLLTAMGYGDGQVTGRTGDGGIDGFINEDKLGLATIYYQAKRWENPVGDRELRDFVGALEIKGATKGVFITTSRFTKPATEYVKQLQQKRIVLIDGDRLGELMIDFDIGVSPNKKFEVKKIDSDYFAPLEL